MTLNNFAREEIDEFVIESKQEQIEIYSRSGDVYNCVDWILPSLIAVFMAKPFCESFFKEAGKDAYECLKSALKVFIKKIEEKKNPPCYISINSKVKEARKIDIYYRADDFLLKFMLPNSLNDYSSSSAIDGIFAIVDPQHEKSLHELISTIRAQSSVPIKEFILEYDAYKNEWRYFDILNRAKEECLKQQLAREEDKKL